MKEEVPVPTPELKEEVPDATPEEMEEVSEKDMEEDHGYRYTTGRVPGLDPVVVFCYFVQQDPDEILYYLNPTSFKQILARNFVKHIEYSFAKK